MREKSVAIIGAGISGLALGWYLKRRFKEEIKISIFEKTSRCGGWIATKKKWGFLFEEGPRSCRTHGSGAATLSLIEELNLTKEILIPSPSANIRYLYSKGHLHPLPKSFFSFFCSPLMKGVVGGLWKEWRVPKIREEVPDESIYDFFVRRFNQEIAEGLIDPLVSGIFAGDIRTLSLRSCFPTLYQWEQEYGSILAAILRRKRVREHESLFVQEIQKKTSLFTLKNGMESLVQHLQEKLKGQLFLKRQIEGVRLINQRVQLIFKDLPSSSFDHVFFAIPASEVFKLLESVAPFPNDQGISFASVAVVNLGWKEKVLRSEGFGYLIPQREKQEGLGVVFDSSAFDQQNRKRGETRLTVMLGGSHRPDVAYLKESEIEEQALKIIREHLKLLSKPSAINIKIAQEAIPQYQLGHGTLLRKAEEALKKSRVTLLGSSWYGVSVNDCIAKAREIAEHHSLN